MDLTISELNSTFNSELKNPGYGLNYSSVETVPGIEARAAFSTQHPQLKNATGYFF